MANKDFNKRLSSSELYELNNQFEQQLADLQGSNNKRAKRSVSDDAGRNFFYKAVLWLLMIIGGLAAPFFVLVRTSVYVYSTYAINGWLALGTGILATIILLLLYAVIVSIRFGKGGRMHRYIWGGIIMLVTAFTLYGLLYYSEVNTKTTEVQNYYRSLHPIMRVALSTVTLADGDVVVTDIHRTPDDYKKMGLPLNQHSLHFEQNDGYVHAVDLRTKGRAEWKNWMTHAAIRVIGLQTIRHVGTADHLHIYLPLND